MNKLRLTYERPENEDARGHHQPTDLIDTTHRKEGYDMRDILIEKAQLEAISMMGVTISHELNQPLTVVMIGTELLLQRSNPEDPQYSLLIKMKQASERMTQQIKRMSRIARYQTTTYVGRQKMIDLETASA